MTVIVLPLTVNGNNIAYGLDAEQHITLAVRRDANAPLDAKVAPSDCMFFDCDATLCLQADEVMTLVQHERDSHTIVEGTTRTKLLNSSKYISKARKGSVLFTLTVSRNVPKKPHSSPFFEYAITIEDTMTGAVYLRADFSEHDLVGGTVPRDKIKLQRGLYNFARMSSQLGGAVSLSPLY